MKQINRTVVAFAAIVALAVPAVANAYQHVDGCSNLGQGTKCVDNTGTNYNPWIWVEANIAPDTREYVCAGAQTAAPNNTWRTNSGCDYRSAQNGGVQYKRATFTASTPNSRAKVWWDSGPSAIAVGYESLRANTP